MRINDGQGADSLNSGLSLGPWLPFFGRPRGRLAAAGAPASSAARLPAEAAAAAGTRAEEEPPASAGWAAACARAASFFCAAFRFASSISSLVGARPSLRVSFSTILPMLSGAGGHAGGDICSLAMAGYPPGLEFRGAHLWIRFTGQKTSARERQRLTPQQFAIFSEVHQWALEV